MNIKFQQDSTDLFSAYFVIFEDGSKVGELSFQGGLGSMEGVWNGFFKSHQINMKRIGGINSQKDFRPYELNVDGRICGSVRQTIHNGGLFHKYEYHTMEFSGSSADLYAVAFGSNVSFPLYLNGVQVAQIDKEHTVYDGLHLFDIYGLDDNSLLISVLFCCYMFTVGYYHAGEKIISGVKKVYSKTTNRELISKYNPEFLRINNLK